MAVNFAIALAATLIFKLALFSYAASGAEGYTSALAWYPRLALCLGWDVVSAAIVGAIATAPALALRSRRPAAIASATVQAAYAIFLVISYHVAVIVGAPLDKAAIDLWFFYADPSVGGTARILSDSVAPYFTPALYVEAAAAVLLPIAAMAWLRRRTPPRLSPRGGGVLVTAVVLTVAGVPGLANGPLAVHTFGLERSPLTMLIGSYARAPLAMFRARGAAPADPFCFDASSPVPIGGTDPLKGVAPKRTNLVLVILE
ncbi:MAG TPA: hypothetical protein VEU08_03005, partial [Vicinamibacterales bacterium]|nr:hypothetical protein [Vicinamibacterales bacterium]